MTNDVVLVPAITRLVEIETQTNRTDEGKHEKKKIKKPSKISADNFSD